jgi:2-hydroxyglutarate dehydrogenase
LRPDYAKTLRPAADDGSEPRSLTVDRDDTLVDDFVISETPGAVHVRNAPPPAATSSLALATELVSRIETAASWPWRATEI